MRKAFASYYRPTDEQFAELWDKALFIFDANVLLNLYTFTDEAREDMFKILDAISDRMWIPYQVALEYQENRRSRIRAQTEKYETVLKAMKKAYMVLDKALKSTDNRKLHAAVDPGDLLTKTKDLFDEHADRLTNLRREQAEFFDKVRDRIDELFEGKVGSPVGSQEELDSLFEEGKKRYELNRPPGFGDVKDKAGKTYLHGGLVYKREYGDWILWHQIIAEIKSRPDSTHVIFVTDDSVKEDWFLRSSGETLGPHPELIYEITALTNVAVFYAYNSERFMSFAREYLKVDISQTSIDEAREIASIGSVDLQLGDFVHPVEVFKSNITPDKVQQGERYTTHVYLKGELENGFFDNRVIQLNGDFNTWNWDPATLDNPGHSTGGNLHGLIDQVHSYSHSTADWPRGHYEIRVGIYDYPKPGERGRQRLGENIHYLDVL